jgi:hypothetical protein
MAHVGRRPFAGTGARDFRGKAVSCQSAGRGGILSPHYQPSRSAFLTVLMPASY